MDSVVAAHGVDLRTHKPTLGTSVVIAASIDVDDDLNDAVPVGARFVRHVAAVLGTL
jgi:hypothetical protein